MAVYRPKYLLTLPLRVLPLRFCQNHVQNIALKPAISRLCTAQIHVSQPTLPVNKPLLLVSARHLARTLYSKKPAVPGRFLVPKKERTESTINESEPEPQQVAYDQNDYSWLVQQPAVIVSRQMELLNIFVGFEQANKYNVKLADGRTLAFILEQTSFSSTIGRQLLGLHRSFKASVIDINGNIIFKVHRPYFVLLSTTLIYDAHDNLLGEVHRSWDIFRRRFELFDHNKKQFGYVDTPFLGMVFEVKDENDKVLGVVDRNFVGLGREIFTDTGEYVVHFYPPPIIELQPDNTAVYRDRSQGIVPLTNEQRAVLLALAISCDFDFFSRHSRGTGLGLFALMALLFGRGAV